MRINGEIDAMRTLTGHPNICALHAVLHTPDNVHIVMDRGQIDLYEYFEGPLPEDEVLGITKVARALVLVPCFVVKTLCKNALLGPCASFDEERL